MQIKLEIESDEGYILESYSGESTDTAIYILEKCVETNKLPSCEWCAVKFEGRGKLCTPCLEARVKSINNK